jgi:hypothetical protein
MLINGVTGNMISIRDRGLLYGDGAAALATPLSKNPS